MLTYLQPSEIINFIHPEVVHFIQVSIDGEQEVKSQIVKLYYAVRDGIRYNPYGIDLTVDGLCGSTAVRRREGWCVTKAALLAGCCRFLGIPAKLGFADVRNHLSTPKMRARMKTDVFYWHGYTSIYIDGRWVKATPAFNVELCERFQLKPLDFDGESDSIYHPFDLQGNKHMEYVRCRGEFADVPVAQISRDFQRHNVCSQLLERCDFAEESNG